MMLIVFLDFRPKSMLPVWLVLALIMDYGFLKGESTSSSWLSKRFKRAGLNLTTPLLPFLACLLLKRKECGFLKTLPDVAWVTPACWRFPKFCPLLGYYGACILTLSPFCGDNAPIWSLMDSSRFCFVSFWGLSLGDFAGLSGFVSLLSFAAYSALPFLSDFFDLLICWPPAPLVSFSLYMI